MGSLKGVGITKGTIGPNSIGPITSPSAILATGVAVAGKLVLNTVYSVTSLKQAEDELGITADYDNTNKVVLHEHIADFYSFPKTKNVRLYIMVVDIATAVPATVLEDTGALYARKLIIAGGGSIKQLGFIYNLEDAAVETLTDGLNTNIRAAIAKAQVLYDWAYSTDRPCNILLEGRGATATVSGLLNLRAIPAGAAILDANKVSVVIGQDYDYAEARTAAKCKKYAGVGKALGTTAAAEVNQSIGEVVSFNLSDAANGKWLTAGLSNHLKVDDLDAYITVLTDKGFIFPGTYTGASGLFWNTDATCTPIIVDENGNINEHTIYYGRTMDYAAQRLKTHLVKLVKQRVNVNTATGKLSTAVIRSIEADANDNVFVNMANEGLISGGKTTIDKNSPVLPPNNTLNAEFDVVPVAILDEINGTLYLRRKL